MTSDNKMQLKDISGFPELSFQEEIVMQQIIQQIKQVYSSFGYIPLETRLVEPLEMLLEKGIDSKEVFVLNTLHKGEIKEKSENEQTLALRFDLTVPFSRFVGQYHNTLPFPLKRYQIQKVYRGETARQSLGRFCEFYQSDIDVIGKETLSMAYDAEFPCIIYKIFKEVLGINKFAIRINNRRLLEGLFLEYGIENTTKLKKAVKVIDNIEKVPLETTMEELVALGLSSENASNIQKFFNVCRNSKPKRVVSAFKQLALIVKNELFRRGLQELADVIQGVLANGVPEQYFMVDPSIARGLDYYTGVVYETNLFDFMHLGSVCSGGRFDNLVGTLSGATNNKFPGCGISIGLSRLIPALIAGGVLRANTMTVAPVLVAVQDPIYMDKYNMIASQLRAVGINTSVNYNGGRLIKQFEYAERAGFKIVIMGRDEIEKGQFQVKVMNSGKENAFVDFDKVVNFVQNILESLPKEVTMQQPSNDRKFLELSEDEIFGELKQVLGLA